MVRKYLVACAAILCAPGVFAATASPNQSKIITATDGTVWYLQDSTVMPLDLGAPGLYQFWVRSDNPAASTVRHWSIRMYLHCPSKSYVPSVIAGYDKDNKLVRFTTQGWAQKNWVTSDPVGLIAAASKTVCAAR
jgi:hypothetical protein